MKYTNVSEQIKYVKKLDFDGDGGQDVQKHGKWNPPKRPSASMYDGLWEMELKPEQ